MDLLTLKNIIFTDGTAKLIVDIGNHTKMPLKERWAFINLRSYLKEPENSWSSAQNMIREEYLKKGGDTIRKKDMDKINADIEALNSFEFKIKNPMLNINLSLEKLEETGLILSGTDCLLLEESGILYMSSKGLFSSKAVGV